jgi:hypothetical protein
VGGKTRTDSDGEVEKGWDHDPPAKEKLVPIGILMVASGALMLVFGARETSDAWVDALQVWWLRVRSGLGHVKRLVISLDNGPKNSGRRTQFLKRMVQFADRSGLEIRLVYYPPYHSKYNPIERCWSALEKKWNGVLLNGLKVVLQCALRMKWKGQHPTVKRLHGEYPDGVRVAAKEMKQYEARLQRSATLPKYDITISTVSRALFGIISFTPIVFVEEAAWNGGAHGAAIRGEVGGDARGRGSPPRNARGAPGAAGDIRRAVRGGPRRARAATARR